MNISSVYNRAGSPPSVQAECHCIISGLKLNFPTVCFIFPREDGGISLTWLNRQKVPNLMIKENTFLEYCALITSFALRR